MKIPFLGELKLWVSLGLVMWGLAQVTLPGAYCLVLSLKPTIDSWEWLLFSLEMKCLKKTCTQFYHHVSISVYICAPAYNTTFPFVTAETAHLPKVNFTLGNRFYSISSSTHFSQCYTSPPKLPLFRL